MKLLDKLIGWIVPKQRKTIPNDCRSTGYIVDGKWHRTHRRAHEHAEEKGLMVWCVKSNQYLRVQ